MFLLAVLLALAAPPAPIYEDLLARAEVALQEGRVQDAIDQLGQAIRLDRERPEAYRARAQVRFGETHYEDAAHDLEAALLRGEDRQLREQLAIALQLAGRDVAAVEPLNPLGQPVIYSISLKGLKRTNEDLVRRELRITPGQVLTRENVRGSRLRLEQVGLFPDVHFHTAFRADRGVDVEVALAERHGFFDRWPEFLARAAGNAAAQRVRVHYANLLGTGMTLRAFYKWESTQPQLAFSAEWPRPFRAPLYFRVEVLRGRPTYDPDSRFRLRTRGIDTSVRAVLGNRTVAEAGYRLRGRTFDAERPYAVEGLVSGLEVAVERRVLDTRRQRLDLEGRAFTARAGLGSDLIFSRVLMSAWYRGILSAPEERPLQRSDVAVALRWGRSGTGTPIDFMFSPGAASEMPLPLRAHRQKLDGVLGRAPIGQTLLLLNLEARQRVLSRRRFQAGLVGFYDAGRVETVVLGDPDWLHDVGVGLRLNFGGSTIFRVDFGHGLTDRKNAVTVGIGQVI